MSHDHHKPDGPITAVETLGPEFGERTVTQLIEKALTHYLQGNGNALEANFGFTSNVGDFLVHFHLCVRKDDGSNKAPAVH